MPASLLRDARYALRVFRRSPGFAAIAVVSLALGIGANTAIFSLVNALLLRALPVASPEQLVLLARNPVRRMTSHSYPDYVYFRDHSKSYTGLIAFSSPSPMGFAGTQGRTELAGVSMVTGNYFEVLGVTPALGRLFNAEDNKAEGAHPYAVLSYGFWQRAFGGDPNVIGRRIRINGSPFSIVGVSRAGFTGASVGSAPDLYIPIMMIRSVNPGVTFWNTRSMWWLTVMGRLKPGVSVARASAENDVLRQQVEAADPERKKIAPWDKDRLMNRRGLVIPGSRGFSGMQRDAFQPLVLLGVVVVLVLLIACANVAGLMLARGAARQREIAIRLAVGAARGRLVRQMLVESVLLALAGGALGVLLAWAGVRALIDAVPPYGNAPVVIDVAPDATVLGFSIAVCVLAGILFGLVPAMKATRPDLVSWLKSEVPEGILSRLGFRRVDLRKVLVAGQIALSIVLLIGAGLFVRSLQKLRDIDPGFRKENILLVRTDPSQLGYKGQRLHDFYTRLMEDAQSLPGVRSATLAAVTPMTGMRWNGSVTVQGYQRKPEEKPYLDFNAVGPRYFETFGVPILLGRDFRNDDSPAVFAERPLAGPGSDAEPPGPPRVAIVNEAFARRYCPGESAVGKRFSQGEKFDAAKSYEIVGVAGNARYFGLRDPIEPMAYLPQWRTPMNRLSLCIRTSVDPRLLTESIRRNIERLDSAVPLLRADTMQQLVGDNMVPERLVAMLCGLFGLLALLLAAIGLYGVMSHAVARRTREIGIRMALGAARAGVLRMVLRDALVLVGAGAVIGIPSAIALGRLVRSQLYGITPQDPFVVVAAVLVLAVVTLAASYVPAIRATRVDPMEALRYE